MGCKTWETAWHRLAGNAVRDAVLWWSKAVPELLLSCADKALPALPSLENFQDCDTPMCLAAVKVGYC
jgi:hypothetical protein